MIERSFQPETVREVRLMKRIRELELKLYEKGIGPMNPSMVPNEVSIRGPLHPTLTLAASVEAGWESDYKFHVLGRTLTGNPKEELSFGYYMGRDAMRVWAPDLRADALLNMHRKVINQLADAVIAQDPE